MIIGITGGSGAGKTTLLRAVRDMGGISLDCDAIYHELLTRDADLQSALAARFPDTVSADGTVDTKKLGALVFADEDALRALNRIAHGAVRREVCRRLETRPRLAAIDAIALFEGGLAELCDVTVAVTAPEEMRVRRLMKRDGISRDYAMLRLHAQHDADWFRGRCKYILENDGDTDAFAAKCLAFLKQLGIMEEANDETARASRADHRKGDI